MRPQAWTFSAALLFAAAASSSAWAYQAGWRATGLYEAIVAADCSDCEEELGIIIACKGNGLPAEVTVNAAASQSGQDGAEAPVTFTIDGEDFTRTARTVEYGLIGFTPVFSLPPDDPIVEALQGGSRAFVSFNGARAKLGLKGSREALDIFKAHCGWTEAGFLQNQARAAAQAASAPPAPAPVGDAGASQTATGKPIATAIYRCEGNKGIDATYYPDSVELTLTDGRSLALPQVISGSGARYANADESFVFWNKGDTAFITEGSDENITFKDCAAIQ
ncbi:MliC family protein [Methyloceanibacter superfactus]|uniref:MliC family protein n=1 Tax=Methyloceanibacter superfactus TaxID=1774969 RepID=UPI0009F65370|nr:MliC family protein [Methyloceanibacter superfactus]